MERPLDELLVIDGYNIINGCPQLKELAKENLEASRDKLIEILRNYQGYRNVKIILVFDGHLAKDGREQHYYYSGLEVVYTKEGDTADNYIERLVHELGREMRIRVATSDGTEQVIIMGRGGIRMSSRELWEDINKSMNEMKGAYTGGMAYKLHRLDDRIKPGVMAKLEKWRRQR